MIVPMSRDQLHPPSQRKVDMVAAMVTVRPELETVPAFSVPTRTDVNELVVTGPERRRSAALTTSPEGGVRPARRAPTTRHWPLNEDVRARGKPAVVIHEAPDDLEDDDVLEMVNAGLAPITIVDDYLAVLLEAGVHQADGAPRPSPFAPAEAGGRLSQGEPPACARRSMGGSADTAKASLPQHDRAPLPRKHDS